MRLKWNRRRDRQRGAAALEFAIASLFLIPLLIGMTQFGYYFYISMNVVEAQHQGLVAASRKTVVTCSATAATLQLATDAASAAVDAYFAANTLSSIVTLYGKTPTCGTDPSNPTWSMTLIADFRPPWGKLMAWDKASPQTSGYLRYTAKTMYIRGQ
jgi:Flp pilus assembly protein TadG